MFPELSEKIRAGGGKENGVRNDFIFFAITH
jgi:hypothetical protein